MVLRWIDDHSTSFRICSIGALWFGEIVLSSSVFRSRASWLRSISTCALCGASVTPSIVKAFWEPSTRDYNPLRSPIWPCLTVCSCSERTDPPFSGSLAPPSPNQYVLDLIFSSLPDVCEDLGSDLFPLLSLIWQLYTDFLIHAYKRNCMDM